MSTSPVFLPFASAHSVLLPSLRPSFTRLPARLNSTSAATPPKENSATQQQHPIGSEEGTTRGNTTSHSPNASEHNIPKDELKDQQEAEAAEAGGAVAEGKYGPGGAVRPVFVVFLSLFPRLPLVPARTDTIVLPQVEGNYTQGTKQAQDRQQASKQGEH